MARVNEVELLQGTHCLSADLVTAICYQQRVLIVPTEGRINRVKAGKGKSCASKGCLIINRLHVSKGNAGVL